MKIILTFHDLLKRFEKVEFLPLFLMRAYLFYVLWFAGVGKVDTF